MPLIFARTNLNPPWLSNNELKIISQLVLCQREDMRSLVKNILGQNTNTTLIKNNLNNHILRI